MTKSGKHCGKWRNCTFCAISSFVTMFSKSHLLQRRQKASIRGKGLTISFQVMSAEFLLVWRQTNWYITIFVLNDYNKICFITAACNKEASSITEYQPDINQISTGVQHNRLDETSTGLECTEKLEIKLWNVKIVSLDYWQTDVWIGIKSSYIDWTLCKVLEKINQGISAKGESFPISKMYATLFNNHIPLIDIFHTFP